MDKVLNEVPNLAPDGPLGTQKKGPLSFIGDPLGHILYFALSPFGYVLRAIGNPNGEALLKVQEQAAKEMKYIDDMEGEKKGKRNEVGESSGGKQQTAGNPLGL